MFPERELHIQVAFQLRTDLSKNLWCALWKVRHKYILMVQDSNSTAPQCGRSLPPLPWFMPSLLHPLLSPQETASVGSLFPWLPVGWLVVWTSRWWGKGGGWARTLASQPSPCIARAAASLHPRSLAIRTCPRALPLGATSPYPWPSKAKAGNGAPLFVAQGTILNGSSVPYPCLISGPFIKLCWIDPVWCPVC